MSTTARHEYDARMHRVLAHIDSHLDQSLDLETLADVAHFSRFHFHRVFLAWTRETLGDYLRRRRLEIAAMRMIAQPRLTVSQVALAVGFTAPEAFARAFKLRFGVSPSAWKSAQGDDRDVMQRLARTAHASPDSNLDQVKRNANQANDSAQSHAAHSTFTLEFAMSTVLPVTLATFPATRVAYMRYTGPFGAPVGQFWQTRMYPFMLAHQLLHHTRYGISLDDPEITEAARCRYDACVEVSDDFVATGDALIATLPGGRYAVCPFSGTSETIPDAWRAVLREWIPESGLQLDNRPLLELYGPTSTYDPATGVFTCDICLPVTPL